MSCETQLLSSLSFLPSYSTTIEPMKSSPSSPRDKKADYLSSRDWMSDYKQSHVDVDYNRIKLLNTSATKDATTTGAQPIISSSSAKAGVSTDNSKKEEETSTGTNWASMYANGIGATDASSSGKKNKTASSSSSSTNWASMYANGIGASSSSSSTTLPKSINSVSSGVLAPLPPSLSDAKSSSSFKPSVDFKASVDFGSILTPSFDAAINHAMSEEFQTPLPPVSSCTSSLPDSNDISSTILALAEKNKAEEAQRKKTQKAQRSKNSKASQQRRFREPIVKEYVTPSDNDVLLGRGGRSNHHPGNKAYRDKVGEIRDNYRSSEKNAKTDLSQDLVNWVQQEQQGRFLKQDDDKKWYVVTNIVARRKASQALREHMTKEEREAMKGK